MDVEVNKDTQIPRPALVVIDINWYTVHFDAFSGKIYVFDTEDVLIASDLMGISDMQHLIEGLVRVKGDLENAL